ncbi:MAG: hypothetical protein ACI8QD_002745 [Cyclobacteriaceae bacterium]|jgi:hypothetical protein
MLPVEEQLSILVHLSRVDEYIADQERDLIHDIGSMHGLTREEIETLIENPRSIANDLSVLPPDEKFEYLFNVVQLMKIDKKVYQKEIDFCEKIAMKLGYKPGVIADLSAYIYSDPSIMTKRSMLRSIADEHLLPKQSK